MPVPPGISFLAMTILQASLLPLTLGILDHLVLHPNKIHDSPTWVTAATCLLSPLTTFSIRLLSSDLVVYVKAKRAGATLPPHNPTWVPGAIHRVIGAIKAEETMYLGNSLLVTVVAILITRPRRHPREHHQNAQAHLQL
jgi:hypothetical protein